ncbi:hypothetical protein FGB62_102g021 [Gracilaria domingensis]|nr:hypothetical protein FGB62_102g021 [Gracilaria domingensis]
MSRQQAHCQSHAPLIKRPRRPPFLPRCLSLSSPPPPPPPPTRSGKQQKRRANESDKRAHHVVRDALQAARRRGAARAARVALAAGAAAVRRDRAAAVAALAGTAGNRARGGAAIGAGAVGSARRIGADGATAIRGSRRVRDHLSGAHARRLEVRRGGRRVQAHLRQAGAARLSVRAARARGQLHQAGRLARVPRARRPAAAARRVPGHCVQRPDQAVQHVLLRPVPRVARAVRGGQRDVLRAHVPRALVPAGADVRGRDGRRDGAVPAARRDRRRGGRLVQVRQQLEGHDRGEALHDGADGAGAQRGGARGPDEPGRGGARAAGAARHRLCAHAHRRDHDRGDAQLRRREAAAGARGLRAARGARGERQVDGGPRLPGAGRHLRAPRRALRLPAVICLFFKALFFLFRHCAQCAPSCVATPARTAILHGAPP